MTIKIELRHSHDEYDCETCGGSYTSGLEVFVDGKLVAGEQARAHCTSESEYPSLESIIIGIMSELHSDFEVKEVFTSE